MKSILFSIAALCLSVLVFGQQKNLNGKWQFHSVNNIGLLEGEAGSAFQIQTINGMQYQSWYAGIGVGLDFYRYRTIPLFVDIRKEFGNHADKFFAYADAGVHFPWLTDNEKTAYLSNGHFNTGFYTDLGLGYKIGLGRTNHLLFSVGYSLKKLEETLEYYYFFPPNNAVDKEHVNYSLNRLSIKVGWEF